MKKTDARCVWMGAALLWLIGLWGCGGTTNQTGVASFAGATDVVAGERVQLGGIAFNAADQTVTYEVLAPSLQDQVGGVMDPADPDVYVAPPFIENANNFAVVRVRSQQRPEVAKDIRINIHFQIRVDPVQAALSLRRSLPIAVTVIGDRENLFSATLGSGGAGGTFVEVKDGNGKPTGIVYSAPEVASGVNQETIVFTITKDQSAARQATTTVTIQTATQPIQIQ